MGNNVSATTGGAAAEGSTAVKKPIRRICSAPSLMDMDMDINMAKDTVDMDESLTITNDSLRPCDLEATDTEGSDRSHHNNNNRNNSKSHINNNHNGSGSVVTLGNSLKRLMINSSSNLYGLAASSTRRNSTGGGGSLLGGGGTCMNSSSKSHNNDDSTSNTRGTKEERRQRRRNRANNNKGERKRSKSNTQKIAKAGEFDVKEMLATGEFLEKLMSTPEGQEKLRKLMLDKEVIQRVVSAK